MLLDNLDTDSEQKKSVKISKSMSRIEFWARGGLQETCGMSRGIPANSTNYCFQQDLVMQQRCAINSSSFSHFSSWLSPSPSLLSLLLNGLKFNANEQIQPLSKLVSSGIWKSSCLPSWEKFTRSTARSRLVLHCSLYRHLRED